MVFVMLATPIVKAAKNCSVRHILTNISTFLFKATVNGMIDQKESGCPRRSLPDQDPTNPEKDTGTEDTDSMTQNQVS
jgi:hypothetical protein